MSQFEDYSAMKSYLLKSTAKTPKALTQQVQFKLWSDELSWFDEHANEDVLAKTKRYRDDFNLANGDKPLVGYSNEYGVIQAAPQTSKEKAAAKATLAAKVPPPERLTIKLGSSGENVKEWQTFLKLTPDGRFGTETRKQTITWQKNNNLFADGVVGPVTWKKALGLNPVQAVGAAVKQAAVSTASAVKSVVSAAVAPISDAIAPKPLVTPTPRVASTSAGTTFLKQGSRGQDVKNWQKVIGVTADGIFNTDTSTATKAWQSKNGLVADGIVGPASWAAAIVLENQPKTTPNPTAKTVDAAKQAVSDTTQKALATVKALPKTTAETFKALPVWQKVLACAAVFGIGAVSFKAMKGPPKI